MRNYLVLLAVLFWFTGCASYSLIGQERRAVGELYSVDPQIAWSMTKEEQIEIWTVDGPVLEAVRFINGLQDGDPLFPTSGDKEKVPHFRAHMTPTEIAEFLVASIKTSAQGLQTGNVVKSAAHASQVRAANINAASIQVTDLRPARFGTLQGFRFDLNFLSREGLKRQGMVVGALHAKKLYLIVYTGAKQYYYPKYKAVVERLIASIVIKS